MKTLPEQDLPPLPFEAGYRSGGFSPLDFLGKAIIVMTVVFNILFPKGGFTVGPIPITWGYIMLGVSACAWLLSRVILQKPLISRLHMKAYLFTVPMLVYVCLSLLLVGVGNSGKSVALLTNVFVLPFIFLVILGTFFNETRYHPLIFRTVTFCVLAAAIYGIVLFVYYWKFKSLFEIPFLTTNGTQDQDLDDKHNARGELLKLISTYNNGNIYGACTLMLLPIYACLASSIPKKFLIRMALLFTLSRTVWIGLVVYEFFSIFIEGKNYVKKLFILVATIIAAFLGIFVLTLFMNRDLDWLIDSNLGGRAETLEKATDTDTIAWFSYFPFNGIAEIVYASVVYSLGICGLLLWLVCQAGPAAVGFVRYASTIFRDERRKAFLLGIGLYWVISASDGAYLYIPTMAFYWFVMTMFCSPLETVD